jgi:hypothetical protein
VQNSKEGVCKMFLLNSVHFWLFVLILNDDWFVQLMYVDSAQIDLHSSPLLRGYMYQETCCLMRVPIMPIILEILYRVSQIRQENVNSRSAKCRKLRLL